MALTEMSEEVVILVLKVLVVAMGVILTVVEVVDVSYVEMCILEAEVGGNSQGAEVVANYKESVLVKLQEAGDCLMIEAGVEGNHY